MIEIKGMKFPSDRKYYTKNGAHLWLKSEGDLIKIGMDAFVSEMVGSISTIFIDKKIVKCDEEIGSFESNKYISKLFSPINGEIIEVNNRIMKNPNLINTDPYKSWIFKIRPVDKIDTCNFLIDDKNLIISWINEEIKKCEI